MKKIRRPEKPQSKKRTARAVNQTDKRTTFLEKYLNDIIDFLPDATLAIDSNKRIIIWNRAIEKMTGIPARDMIGRGDYAYTIPFYGTARPQLMDLFWEPRHKIAVKYPILKKEGKNLVIEVFCPALYNGKGAYVWAKASPIRDSRGRLIGAVECIRDISPYKQVEAALRESEQKYRSILENIQDMVYRSDRHGNLIMASPSFAELLGYSSLDECLGKNIAENFYLHPPDREKFLQAVNERGFVKDYEITLKHRDGTPVAISTSSHLYYDADRQIAGVEGVFRDISELKRAESRLRESENKIHEIIRGSPIPCFIIGADHRVIFWNKALAELSKVPAEEVVGTNAQWKAFYGSIRPCLADLLVDENHEAIKRWYQGKFEKSPLIDEAYTATDFFPELGKDGKWLHFTAALIRDSSGKIMGAIETLEDVTERKKIEQAQRLTQLGQLISVVAHEVNNPLMIISGTAQLNIMKQADTETLKKNLQVIFEECQKAKSIIERLLKFSRPSKGVIAHENINRIVDTVLDLLDDQFKLLKISVKKNYGAGIPVIPVNAKQIQEVLINILNNAKDSISGSGAIEVATEREDGFVKISVKDTGSGMPEEIMKRILDPFFTTKETGTGLGLPVSFGIIKEHHGEMKFDSRIGEGTTVTILLPLKWDEHG